ncbi:MAG: hypothetical protein NVS2B3_01760 [Vulcanimicrobiaceae bacterium]
MNKSNTSNTVDVVADILIAPVTAYLATHVMGSVRMGLYKRESEAERAREDAVRPGPPYELAAKETLGALGSPVDGRTLERERERDVAIPSNENAALRRRCASSAPFVHGMVWSAPSSRSHVARNAASGAPCRRTRQSSV